MDAQPFANHRRWDPTLHPPSRAEASHHRNQQNGEHQCKQQQKRRSDSIHTVATAVMQPPTSTRSHRGAVDIRPGSCFMEMSRPRCLQGLQTKHQVGAEAAKGHHLLG